MFLLTMIFYGIAIWVFSPPEGWSRGQPWPRTIDD
jgi:hypothetical protein